MGLFTNASSGIILVVMISIWFSKTFLSVAQTRESSNNGGKPQVIIEVEDSRGRRTTANTTLYRRENGSLILYDGENVLNTLQYIYACYIITCKASYPINWATNIPLKKFTPDIVCSGGDTWKYFNSRRLHDNPFQQESETGKQNSHYLIQLMFGIEENNSGLLKCESIENPTVSAHYYFYPVSSTKELVSFLPSGLQQEIRYYEFEFMELFWEKKTKRTFKGEYRSDANDQSHSREQRMIWDQDKGRVDKEFKTDIHYDPVIGFTLDSPNLAETLKLITSNNYGPLSTVSGLVCETDENDEKSRLSFELFVYSSNRQTAKITVVENQAQFAQMKKQNGCTFIRNDDTFAFRRSGSDLKVESAQKHHALKFLHCNFPHECDILRQCLDFQGGDCYSDRGQLQVGADSLERPHNRGMLRCMDYQGEIGFKPIYEYTFIGLDKIRYVLSEDIPSKAVIFIDETQPVLYTNVENTFRCQICHFILVPNIRFGLVFTDGRITLIETKNSVSENGTYDTDNLRNVMNSNYNLGIGWEDITLNLTADVRGIMCFAPFHNSSDWVNVTRSFVSKDVKRSEINKAGGKAVRTFFRDDKDFSLRCEARGAPEPKITWILPDDDSNQRFVGVNEITNEDGNSFLLFPPMKKDFAGIYTCVATNPYGTDTYLFDLKFQESGLGWGGIVGITLACIVIVGIFAGFLILWKKYRYAQQQLRDLTEEEVNEFKNGDGKEQENSGVQINISMLPFKDEYIINPEVLATEKNVVLGEGQFGIVHRGLLNGSLVAVKTTKSAADVTYVKAFLGELKIMAYIGNHPHIVKFLGAVINQIRERSVQAVVELCPLGNLHGHLRKLGTNKGAFVNLVQNDVIVPESCGLTTYENNAVTDERKVKVTTLDLIDWCKQIADGMHYLASKRVYHGDLAARNILVFNDNIVKITDFGLSKQLYSSPSYVKKQKVPLPWRWMAIESLRFMEFSIESDVWAFAVTVWEIFTLGETPYPGLTWTTEFVTILCNGMRMGKPQNCPKAVYDEIMKCWSTEVADRPTFADLTNLFARILNSHRISSSPGQNESHQGVKETEIHIPGGSVADCYLSLDI